MLSGSISYVRQHVVNVLPKSSCCFIRGSGTSIHDEHARKSTLAAQELGSGWPRSTEYFHDQHSLLSPTIATLLLGDIWRPLYLRQLWLSLPSGSGVSECIEFRGTMTALVEREALATLPLDYSHWRYSGYHWVRSPIGATLR